MRKTILFISYFIGLVLMNAASAFVVIAASVLLCLVIA